VKVCGFFPAAAGELYKVQSLIGGGVVQKIEAAGFEEGDKMIPKAVLAASGIILGGYIQLVMVVLLQIVIICIKM